jgi:branched-chain amino acid aminotransferase
LLLKELLKIDKQWVANLKETSLYIRPTAIAFNNSLGVRSPDTSKLFIVCSPVGSYYP